MPMPSSSRHRHEPIQIFNGPGERLHTYLVNLVILTIFVCIPRLAKHIISLRLQNIFWFIGWLDAFWDSFLDEGATYFLLLANELRARIIYIFWLAPWIVLITLWNVFSTWHMITATIYWLGSHEYLVTWWFKSPLPDAFLNPPFVSRKRESW